YDGSIWPHHDEQWGHFRVLRPEDQIAAAMGISVLSPGTVPDLTESCPLGTMVSVESARYVSFGVLAVCVRDRKMPCISTFQVSFATKTGLSGWWRRTLPTTPRRGGRGTRARTSSGSAEAVTGRRRR